MAEVNKGITISFRGDTIEFDKSVDGINKAIKTLGKDTQALNKELKFDPTNAEKLNTKLKNLTQTEDLLKQKLSLFKNELQDLGKIDNKEKEAEFKRISSAIQDCEKSLSSVQSQMRKLDGNNVKDTADAFGDASDNASMFGDILSANILSSAIMTGLSTLASLITSIGSEFADIIASGVEYNAQMEAYQTSFKAILGDEQKATDLIDRLRKNASVSPFDVDALVSSTQALLTTGIEGEKAEKVIMALGDAIAYTGGGNSELKRMSANLQQVKNVGKATAMDIRQFAMAGIDIYGILADSMGTTTLAIKDMDISYQDLEKALIKASEEGGKYFGAMERQVDTYSGKLGQLENKWNEFTGQMAQPVNDMLQNDIFPVLQQIIDELAPTLTDMVDRLTTFITDHKDELVGMVEDIIGYLTSQETKDFFEMLFDLLTNKIPELIDNLNILGVSLRDIKGLLDVILALAIAVVDWLNKILTFDLDSMFYSNSAWQSFNKYGGGSISSGGFNGLASGGFASGGITMTNNFTINNANNVTQAQVQQWSSWLAESVNERLGEMI